MTVTTGTRMTAAEYLQLPEQNTPMELLDGEIVVSPSPTPEHQDLVGNTYILLKQRSQALGGQVYFAPLDVYLGEESVPQPDLVWLAPNSKCSILEKRLSGPPDLVVEILSPGSIKRDRQKKFRIYERHGVREYWLVDPRDRLIEVWQWIDGRFTLLDIYSPGERFESSLLGTIEVSAIFGE